MKLTPPVARYEQVARDLRQRILAGEWAPGVTLPGAPAMAREYGVTQSVAQRALETLVAWRLARVGDGRGTVVLPLHRYAVVARIALAAPGIDADAYGRLLDALEAVVADDPMAEAVGAALAGDGPAVAAVILAAHSGHAADRLCELIREAAGRDWDLDGASVEARPEQEDRNG